MMLLAHKSAASSNVLLAAWYLGRTLNAWGKPRQISPVLLRARQGFAKLAETAWVAACDWQLNELPWTKPDFLQASHTLAQALDVLERFGFADFAPRCRMALAYAQILTGEYEKAQRNTQASEADFAASGDVLNQARCWMQDANRFAPPVVFHGGSRKTGSSQVYS